MITILYGPNSYALRQKLHQLSTLFTASHQQHSVEKYDGDQLTPAQLPDIMQGMSLFSTEKFVVIRGAAGNKQLWEALEPWVEKVPDEIQLILVEQAPDKRTKTFKTLQKRAHVLAFEDLQPPQLERWLIAEAEAQGTKLSPSLARQLVERVGIDQWQLRHELDKVLSLEGPITRETIVDIVDASPQASAFDLLDAAFRGQGVRVRELLAILEINEDPYRFFGLLVSQVYALAIAVAGKDRSSSEVATAAGVHPFVLKKLSSLITASSRTDISAIATVVAIADDQLKGSGAEPWLIIEQALMKIASR
ncbi:MAG TPA: DNA polymerase III subunit delta [Candidatus Saccharimonadales bacterium]|jgi:DNA polymerase-3 subunit delta|nr:DNA polymerase III subunit delta [Candidatus Saccharimonadales bacterium]